MVETTNEMTVGGPYLCAALFCEKILEESDGVNSVVRIIDRFTFQGNEEEMPASTIELTAFILLKAGDYRGSSDLSLEPESPSGHKFPKLTLQINFEGEGDRGVAVKIPIRFRTKEPGLYWFSIERNQELITRMPLRLVYQRNPVSGSVGTENNPDK